MQITLTLSPELAAEAAELTGIKDQSALIREALMALVQRERARNSHRFGDVAKKLPRRGTHFDQHIYDTD